jgi:hypothetical protein
MSKALKETGNCVSTQKIEMTDSMTGSVFKVACYADLANVRRAYAYLHRIVYEKDMPTRPLHASPSVHSLETICGETMAEFCANYLSLRRKLRKLLIGEVFSPHCVKLILLQGRLLDLLISHPSCGRCEYRKASRSLGDVGHKKY